MRFLLYGNGGSGNHGCEAIVRGTVDLLGKENNDFVIYSEAMREDCAYGLQRLAQIEDAKNPIRRDVRFLAAYMKMKIFHDYAAVDGLYYLPQIRRAASKADIAMSVGGDNYCYGGTDIYRYLNREYKKAGLKTVLWGCSVEPAVISNPKVAEDLKQYCLVAARESITYQAMKEVNPNTILAPDPAFFMKSQECEVEERLKNGNVIGINISPMIISNEKSAGITIENYRNLIRYILKNTTFDIALIPHVVWERNDDRAVLQQIYDEFAGEERLILVGDYSAPELKYIISLCRILIGARTHATIAAYSTYVPTLTVGYSVKARGIARDLFGKEEGYVIPVQSLNEVGELAKAFENILLQEQKIRQHLTNILPGYLANGKKAIQAIKDM